MNVDVVEHKLRGGIRVLEVSSLIWLQVIACVHSHVRLFRVSVALDENTDASAETSDNEAAFGVS